jgi:hypothetical protein
MRKIMFASVALVGLMLAGALVWTAEAATGAGTLGQALFADREGLLQIQGPLVPDRLHQSVPHVEMLVRALSLRQEPR